MEDDHPEIFLIQLRAMLRANAGLNNLQVMFPMISTVGEVDAVDRNNAAVTTPYDSMHPAVLVAIDHVVKAARLQQKHVSICGEMAGEPAGALLLLGMGVDALSMSPASLPRVKCVIRRFTLQRARELLDDALDMEDGFAIHRLINGSLREAGLTGSRST